MTSLRMHLIAVVALAGCQPVSLPDRPAAERSPDRPENGATWKVVRVIDGDTLEVLRDRKSLKIRLQGIDCPERQQAFGTEATQFTSQQSIDRQVILRTSGLDRYGRTLADVHLPDGRSLSRELVRSGFAWHYKKYSDDDALSRCEREARQAKRGLWAGTDPTPPWQWRAERRARQQPDSQELTIHPNGVAIVGLLPNPEGSDEGHEQATIGNTTQTAVDLDGWKLVDKAGNVFRLSGRVETGSDLVVTMTEPTMPLNNKGDSVLLVDPAGVGRSRASYLKSQVQPGVALTFLPTID
ncbi:MAG: hypothetical protein CMJ59_05545 [Planctomycetaceae bacterium]|nr:hypothetical protein [Planctomycetaceae bacterium]